MLKSITAPKLADILPESIKNDDKIFAAATFLDSEIEKIAALTDLTLHLPRLDELPADVLDHLAWQYHCDFYRQDLPLKAKRDQIRESIFWHRIKGTPAGVEKAVSTFMQGATVEENWEYGGEDYFFRITCKGLKYLSTEEEFLRLVFSAKNVRSWLEGIIFDLTVDEPETDYVAMIEVEGGEEIILPNLDDIKTKQNIFQSIVELETGYEEVGYFQTATEKSDYKVAIVELEGGEEIINALNKSAVEDEFFFEKWIADQWKKWKKNPVIEPYLHPEGELYPTDDDFFPVDQDFLKLYFKYPNNKIKYFTLYNPKDNLKAADINVIGLLSKDALNNPTGLVKALLVKKTAEKIL